MYDPPVGRGGVVHTQARARARLGDAASAIVGVVYGVGSGVFGPCALSVVLGVHGVAFPFEHGFLLCPCGGGGAATRGGQFELSVPEIFAAHQLATVVRVGDKESRKAVAWGDLGAPS